MKLVGRNETDEFLNVIEPITGHSELSAVQKGLACVAVGEAKASFEQALDAIRRKARDTARIGMQSTGGDDESGFGSSPALQATLARSLSETAEQELLEKVTQDLKARLAEIALTKDVQAIEMVPFRFGQHMQAQLDQGASWAK